MAEPVNRATDERAEPLREHDCPLCKFLGIHNGFDLYWCGQGSLKIPTVIARFGWHPGDYKSGLRLVRLDPELAEAKRRAETLGLNCEVVGHG